MSEILVDLPMAFGGKQTEELNDIVILPLAYNRAGTGTITSPYPWTDYQEIVIGLGIFAGGDFGSATITKERVAANPTGFIQHINYTDNANVYILVLAANSETTMTWSGLQDGAAFAVYPSWVIGRRKKYATTNLTTTLQVNSGNNIAVNSRYEIPASALPANFLNKDGTIKDNVELRTIFTIPEGDVELEMGELFNSTISAFTFYGVSSRIAGNKIYVATAGYGGAQDSLHNRALIYTYQGSSVGAHATAFTAKCRVVATLSGEAYTVQTA